MAGLRADADVHVVDHHLAEAVHDQVDRVDRALDDDPGRLLGVERDPDAAGEVVARAQRHQADDGVPELVAAVQGGDHGVQAAVAAGHHDLAPAPAVQHAVELALVRRGRHLDVRRGA